MPVRCHCSTTSLKTTSHGRLFRPMLFWPGCRTSLNRRKEVSPFTFSLRAVNGAGFCLPVCVKESGGTMGRSSTRSLDDFGTASCFTVSMYSIRAKASRVLSRRGTAADAVGQSKIILPETCKPQGWNFDDGIPVVQPRGQFDGSASFPGPSSRSEETKIKRRRRKWRWPWDKGETNLKIK